MVPVGNSGDQRKVQVTDIENLDEVDLPMELDKIKTIICTVSVNEILDEILRDTEFYIETGGGVTLSGGEPLMQYNFCLELLKKLKGKNINTAIETCGYCRKKMYEIAKYTDLWLFDIKLFSENEHIKYTGVSNKWIFKNLHYIDSIGKKIILRCPIIPGINFNEVHFEKISHLTATLKNVIAVHLEPYHPLGMDKALRIGKNQEYKNTEFLSPDALYTYAHIIREATKTEVEIL